MTTNDNTPETTTGDTCPFCGSNPLSLPFQNTYWCGLIKGGDRTEMCRALERASKAEAELAEERKENCEQARLLAMSASRESATLGKLERERRDREKAEAELAEVRCQLDFANKSWCENHQAFIKAHAELTTYKPEPHKCSGDIDCVTCNDFYFSHEQLINIAKQLQTQNAKLKGLLERAIKKLLVLNSYDAAVIHSELEALK